MSRTSCEGITHNLYLVWDQCKAHSQLLGLQSRDDAGAVLLNDVRIFSPLYAYQQAALTQDGRRVPGKAQLDGLGACKQLRKMIYIIVS